MWQAGPGDIAENLPAVIPGRRETASPESIAPALRSMDSGLLASLGPGMTAFSGSELRTDYFRFVIGM
jgi:hypothetical protein